MRLLSLIRKTTLENLRDWKILVLTLTFAPFFTILMYYYFEAATGPAYRVAIVNEDEGRMAEGGVQVNLGADLLATFVEAGRAEPGQTLRVSADADRATAVEHAESGRVDLVLVIPPTFTRTLEAFRDGEEPPTGTVTTYGDPGNPSYLMAAAWSDAITYIFAGEVAEVEGPITIDMQSVGDVESLSEFDLYIPGLLALAVIMLMFTAAASVIKEKDKGTLVRLRISNMTTFEWLLSITLVQTVLGVIAVLLTLLTAMALGYNASGSVPAIVLVSALSSVAVVGISILVSAWLRTIFDLMTIGCFPFFILMFFSGSMFPLPDLPIFEIAGRSINANDILPTTHSISAFNDVLNHSAGIGQVMFEIFAIAALSVVFFAGGTLWFTRRHMSPNAV